MNGRVFRSGNARVEPGEVADFVSVAPIAAMAPAGALDFEVDAYATRIRDEFGVPVALDAVVGATSQGPHGQYRHHQHHCSEPHHEIPHGHHLRISEDARAGDLFHED